jgi:hypothetical protein
MMPRLEAAKIQPWRDGNMFGFKEVAAKPKGIATKGTDVCVEIKSTFWLDGDAKA